jgi:hypothetical protein
MWVTAQKYHATPLPPCLTGYMTSPESVGSAHRAEHLRIALGSRIMTRRISLGLRQEDLGHLAGMHRTYVGSVERGERNISLENLDRLATALGMSIAALLDGL